MRLNSFYSHIGYIIYVKNKMPNDNYYYVYSNYPGYENGNQLMIPTSSEHRLTYLSTVPNIGAVKFKSHVNKYYPEFLL